MEMNEIYEELLKHKNDFFTADVDYKGYFMMAGMFVRALMDSAKTKKMKFIVNGFESQISNNFFGKHVQPVIADNFKMSYKKIFRWLDDNGLIVKNDNVKEFKSLLGAIITTDNSVLNECGRRDAEQYYRFGYLKEGFEFEGFDF